MAIVSVEHVVKLMRKEECPFWRLSGTTGVRNLIDENEDEENVEKGVELLQECIDSVEDNHVHVVISDKTKKEKAKGGRNFKQYEFKLNLRKTATGIEGIGNNGSLLSLLLAQMKENSNLQLQLIMEKNKAELDLLKLEMKDKKGGNKNFEILLPYLDKILGNKTVGIAGAGVDDGPVNETMVEKQNRIRDALVRLSKVDEHLPDTLTLLANFAEKNPEKYKSYLPMLTNL